MDLRIKSKAAEKGKKKCILRNRKQSRSITQWDKGLMQSEIENEIHKTKEQKRNGK